MNDIIELRKRSPEKMAEYFALELATKQNQINDFRSLLEESVEVLVKAISHYSKENECGCVEHKLIAKIKEVLSGGVSENQKKP